MKHVGNSLLAGLLLFGSLALTGCDVEKARALQGAAAQFRNESLTAINAIDTMRRKELEPPPRTSSDARQEFVNRLLNSRSEITSTLIELAIDPYTPPSVPSWDNFIVDLRSQYEGFSAIFDQLDRGSLVGMNEVRKSAEYARILTVQMVLLADAISKNPPILTQYRASVIVKLRQARRDYQDIQAKLKAREAGGQSADVQQLLARKGDLERQTGGLMDEWLQLRQQEQKLLETTVAQCLKAAVMGKELGGLINDYDKLSLDQINRAIPRILNVSSSVTGRDYSALQVRASTLVSEIKADPLWNAVANNLIDRANLAASSRLQALSGTAASPGMPGLATPVSLPR